MRRWLLPLAVVWPLAALAGTPDHQKIELDGVRVSEVARLVYGDALHTAYLLDPAVVDDSRAVSFRWEGKPSQLHTFLADFFHALGYEIERRGTLDVVAKAKEPPAPPAAERQPWIYRPRYRDPAYLSDLLRPMFPEAMPRQAVTTGQPGVLPAAAFSSGISFPATRTLSQTSTADFSAPAVTATSQPTAKDILALWVTQSERAKLDAIVPQIDTPAGEVVVRGAVYEVQTDEKNGSAISMVTALLGKKLTLSYNAGTTPMDGFIQLKTSTIDAVLSALSSDSRFKIVSSPVLRIASGRNGRFSVGQDVPVLGSVAYPTGAGQAVQSVEYRSSGVIFDLSPEVRQDVTELVINQQLSNFVATDTGVNNSPTLIKREVRTAVSLGNGDIVLLGGLAENKTSEASTGLSFLPSFLKANTDGTTKTEILLVLQLQKV